MFSYFCSKTKIVDTRKVVLACTHDLSFEQKLEKMSFVSSENYLLYSREKLQYTS